MIIQRLKGGIFSIVVFLLMASFSEAATLNLRATWTANTEPDMKEYRLYRTDGTRTLIGTILHPATSYDFTTSVPDTPVTGTCTFVLTAVDTNNNQSPDSLPASYNYNLDSIPPGRPAGLIIIKQTTTP